MCSPTNSDAVAWWSTSHHIGTIYTHSNANWLGTARQRKVLYMLTDSAWAATGRSWKSGTVTDRLRGCVRVHNGVISGGAIQSIGDVDFLLPVSEC